MWDKCTIVLDKDIYYPGETVTGKIELHLKFDKRVRSVKVTILGQATVTFEDQKDKPAIQQYVNEELSLLKIPEFSDRDTVLVHTGIHPYPFSYDLPKDIPSSLNVKIGSIRYEIRTEVDLPGSIGLTDSKTFTVGSYLDLNVLPASIRNPVYKTEVNDIIFLCCRQQPLSIRVEIPVRAYVPSQVINFKCTVRNKSRLNVSKVSFKILQIFEFFAMHREERKEIRLSKEYLKDSAVRSGTDKSFDVELTVPSNTLSPNLSNCTMIKMHCELIGKAVLPYPHFDLIIAIPFILGTVPLKNSTPPTSNSL